MSKERIIESLEYCRKNQKSNDCESCEYGGISFQICERLVDDVLVLLKEQKEVVRCKYCKYFDGEGCNNINSPCKGIHTYADWFCADGKPYCSRCGCDVEIGKDLCDKCMYEAQVEIEEYNRMYEPTYNPEDGSM